MFPQRPAVVEKIREGQEVCYHQRNHKNIIHSRLQESNKNVQRTGSQKFSFVVAVSGHGVTANNHKVGRCANFVSAQSFGHLLEKK